MPYHIDEENSELAFEVREGNKLVIKIKSNIFSDSLELYLIKVGDNTEPTDKNVFSSLRVLKEIENLHDTILKEINSVTSGFWELKQDSQGNEYIATKYNVLTEGGLTTYGLGEQKLGTIYDGLPIDNDTIYWEEVEGSRVLKAKGSGGGSTGLDETKLWNVLGTPGDQQIDYSHLRSAFSQFSNDFVTINTEQEITALKHFTAGLSVGESKKKIYEENGVVYIDADVAVTGAMTFYATAGRTVSTIMDAVTVDGITIKKENNVLKAVSGAGSSFDENAMWSALSGSSDNQINKSHLTMALDGYATRNWVIENYATKSELSAVSNKLNDFLEGSDTDTIINKWKELEAFLSGMVETDNLAEILETKADKKYVDSTFVTLATKQTITGEKTFSSVLNTAAIKASGAITAPSLAVSDWVTIAGIKLRKLEDGALMLEGNLALTGALTMYASNGQSFDTIYDGLPIDNDTIYWQEVDGSRVLKAREGSGSSFDKSAMWAALEGATTEQINKTHLTTALNGYATESWVTSKNYLTSVSIATISDLHANWDALLKAAPSAYVTRWPTISEVTNKQNLIVKLNGGTTEGTNQFTYNATGTKTINITPAGIGAYTKSESDSKYPTKTGSGASGTWGINISGNASNADKLDGTHKRSGNTYWDVIPYIDSDGTFEVGKYIDFHNSSTGTIDYSTRLQCDGDHNNTLILPTIDGNLALLSDNVASASKLQTERKIWGIGFNGTKDVVGNITLGDYDIIGHGGARIIQNLGSNLGINPSGYVGIGTTSPSYKLHVNGGIYGSSDIRGARYILDDNTLTGLGSSEMFTSNLSSIRYSSDRIYVNGGTFRPIIRWGDTVNGRGYHTRYVFGSARDDANDWGRIFMAVSNNDAGTSTGCSFSIYGAGYVEITGNILATGGSSFYGSDIRYKSIIHPIMLLALNKIAEAPSFVYRWNKQGMNQKRLNLGGSAQYTQSVLPWAVEDNDNFLSMDYATVAYTFAVHTARHLLTYETRTDKKIKKLENRVKYLEKQLKKLGYEEASIMDDQ